MHFWRESCEITGGNFGDACNVLLNSLVDGQKDLEGNKRDFIFGSHLRYATKNKKVLSILQLTTLKPRLLMFMKRSCVSDVNQKLCNVLFWAILETLRNKTLLPFPTDLFLFHHNCPFSSPPLPGQQRSEKPENKRWAIEISFSRRLIALEKSNNNNGQDDFFI